MEKMNLYQKLQNVRVELNKLNLQKSGFNPFAKFKYFELGDFLPSAQELMLKYNLFAYEEIDTNLATITVIDAEDLNTIPFTLTMPSTTVELKGATTIQNLSSVQTYMRRYLWTALLAITESDALDATIGKDEKPGKKAPVKTSEDDPIAELKTLCTVKAKEGKLQQVTEIVERCTGVKNPSAVKDIEKAKNAIEELSKL